MQPEKRAVSHSPGLLGDIFDHLKWSPIICDLRRVHRTSLSLIITALLPSDVTTEDFIKHCWLSELTVNRLSSNICSQKLDLLILTLLLRQLAR